jgi:hypothetical protein
MEVEHCRGQKYMAIMKMVARDKQSSFFVVSATDKEQ